MFFDRDRIYWDWVTTCYFWLPFEKHFYRLKWDEVLGAKLLLDRKIGEHVGPILLIGVTRCESVTPAELKKWQEFVVTHVEQPPWESTLPIVIDRSWLWNAEEVVAQIEETLSDKSLREQWGDPPQ